MKEHQYERMLNRRRHYEPGVLFSDGVLDGMLRAAARGAQRLEMARQAWARVVPESVLTSSNVHAFDGGTLSVTVMEPALHHRLRCEQEPLRRQLVGLLPGLRRLRFVGWRSGEAGAGSSS